MVTYEDVRNDSAVATYIRRADETLGALGFTEHSFAHVTAVAEKAARILTVLGYPERTVELGRIAGYLHDIGNLVNRVDHSQSGAVMAFRILDRMGVEADEIATVISAIGNHDEGTGVPVNPVAAALILADKSDVRRSRVRNRDLASFDIHDRVNYSVESSRLDIDPEGGLVELVKAGFETLVDAGYPPELAYFECYHEMKMIGDLMYESGIHFMNYSISNNAEFGGYVTGPKVVSDQARAAMRKALSDIQDGSYAKNFLLENQVGAPMLRSIRAQTAAHPIEVVGARLRPMMPFISAHRHIDRSKN